MNVGVHAGMGEHWKEECKEEVINSRAAERSDSGSIGQECTLMKNTCTLSDSTVCTVPSIKHRKVVNFVFPLL